MRVSKHSVNVNRHSPQSFSFTHKENRSIWITGESHEVGIGWEQNSGWWPVFLCSDHEAMLQGSVMVFSMHSLSCLGPAARMRIEGCLGHKLALFAVV